jgi:hypothetical protein
MGGVIGKGSVWTQRGVDIEVDGEASRGCEPALDDQEQDGVITISGDHDADADTDADRDGTDSLVASAIPPPPTIEWTGDRPNRRMRLDEMRRLCAANDLEDTGKKETVYRWVKVWAAVRVCIIASPRRSEAQQNMCHVEGQLADVQTAHKPVVCLP